jgi:hypothetical protein
MSGAGLGSWAFPTELGNGEEGDMLILPLGRCDEEGTLDSVKLFVRSAIKIRIYDKIASKH